MSPPKVESKSNRTTFVGFIILIFSINLFSCKSKVKQKDDSANSSVVVSDSLAETESDLKSPEELREHCVRGEATPLVIKSVFPNTTFQLQPDSLSAIETVNFDNGDKLIINNYGCEYYVLTFRFETSRFQDDTTNIPFWFKKSCLLLSEIYDGIDCVISLKEGVDKLVNYIDADQPNNYQNLELLHEIDFGGTDMRDVISVDRIEKMSADKYAIEITFWKGPL